MELSRQRRPAKGLTSGCTDAGSVLGLKGVLWKLVSCLAMDANGFIAIAALVSKDGDACARMNCCCHRLLRQKVAAQLGQREHGAGLVTRNTGQIQNGLRS